MNRNYNLGYICVDDLKWVKDLITDEGFPVEIDTKEEYMFLNNYTYRVTTWVAPPVGNIYFPGDDLYKRFWAAYNSKGL